MKWFYFAKRNIKEIIRDPLSIIFCVVLPVFMLIIFQVIDKYAQGMFSISRLCPAMCVFSLSFVMLFMALLVSKDRTSSFLNRLYSSPMTTVDYVLGYMIPGFVISLVQCFICLVVSFIISLISNTYFSFLGSLTMIVALIPTMILFISVGIAFGSLFSDKAAPGASSTIITLSGFISGAWMPLELMGGFEKVCKIFPFYPAVIVSRQSFLLAEINFNNFWLYFLIVLAYATVIFIVSLVAFRKRMTSDKK